jgi:TetR/AcrR family transcriptional regulator, cholesterol catabolism regulator
MTQEQEKLPLSRKKNDQLPEKKRVRLTQQVIVDTAAEEFAKKGFGATSLDDIAEILGATKGALYYHIKNKEEILRLIYVTVLTASEEPLRHIVEATLSPAEKLHQAIKHQITVATDRSPAMTIFYRENHHLTGSFAQEIILRKKNYERYFEQIIAEGQAVGTFQSTIDPKIAAFGLLGMCNWLSQWYRPGGQYSVQQITAMFVDMLENGLQLH